MRDSIRGGALTETTFLILLSLWEPRHGYAVMQFLISATGGRLTLGAGTLYGALNSLLGKRVDRPFRGAGRAKKSVLHHPGRQGSSCGRAGAHERGAGAGV